jgi:hypothetical protein
MTLAGADVAVHAVVEQLRRAAVDAVLVTVVLAAAILLVQTMNRVQRLMTAVHRQAGVNTLSSHGS